MSTLLLTQSIVDGLKCEYGKSHTEYCDLQVRGLLVYCTKSPSYVPKYQVRGKNAAGTNQFATLGTIRELTLAQARKLALQTKQLHATRVKAESAIPPVATPQELTWAAFMGQFADHCKAHLRSARKYLQLDKIYCSPRFGHLLLSQITRKEVQALHVEIVDKLGMSPATADHVVKFMRRALNLAVQWDILERNPLRNFELFLVSNEIENYLDSEQMERLLAVLRTDKNRNVCLALMLILSTGARLNEILSATWKNVSMEGRVLKVDAIRSKSKRSRSIPLNDSAMWVVEQLKSKDKSAYLFPSPVLAKQGKDQPYGGISALTWARIKRKAGIHIRIHDLRHGFASMLVSGGRSLYEVQQILGHSDPKVTMRYAHLSSKTLQEAANAGSVIVPRVEAKAA